MKILRKIPFTKGRARCMEKHERRTYWEIMKECGTSKAINDTEVDMLYESENETEVATESSKWDSYDENTNDVLPDKLL